MQGTKKCPQCGTELPPDAPEGNCPTCLVRLGLAVDVGETPPADGGGDRTPASSQDLVAETEHIGPYTVLNKLGQGGTGEVWLGYDSGLERQVAIKVLKAQLQTETDQAAGFLQEARTAAQLNHPNVITVFQVGHHAGRFFIAMEYLPRGSLQDELNQRGRLNYREATLIIRDAVCGLWAAHQAGIVHRDIKPGNLLRAENGMTKVADFGMARLETSSSTLTHSGRIHGTPSFIAPEQVRREALDARADLYSLTCTYYALLTGHPPFTRGGEQVAREVLLHRHLHDPFPDAREEVPELPASIAAVLHRGSQKDPAARYPSALELYRDLERVLSDSRGDPAVLSGQPQSRPEFAKAAGSELSRPTAGISRRRRNRQKPIVWVAAAGILILAAAWMALMMRKPMLDKLATASHPALREATFAEPAIQWVQPADKELAEAKDVREQKLKGLAYFSWETIAEKFFPQEMGGLQTWSESNLELPDRFLLLGNLAAVRVVEGKTWVCIGFGGSTFTVLTLFDNARVAEEMVDYRVGDAVRVLTERTNWGHFAASMGSHRTGLVIARGVEGQAVVTKTLEEHIQCFCPFQGGDSFLCFRGEALEKSGEPLSWIDATRGRVLKPANAAEALASPGMIYRELTKWLGKQGVIEANFQRAQATQDGLRVFLIGTNSLEGPIYIQLEMGKEARAEEFQDYAPGDMVLAEILLLSGQVNVSEHWDPEWARPVLRPARLPRQIAAQPRQPMLTNSPANPLTAWNGILASCSSLQKAGLPATLVAAHGPRRHVGAAVELPRPPPNPALATTPGKEVLVTGMLTCLFALEGEAHCVVATEQPEAGALTYEAYTRQPGFMDALADYISSRERQRNGDIVRVRGVLRPPEVPNFRLAKDAVLLRLKEIERAGSPASRVVVGQARSLATMETNRAPSSLMQLLRNIPAPGTEVKFSGFFYDVCYDGRVTVGPGEGMAYGSMVSSRPVVPIHFPKVPDSAWTDYEASEAPVEVVAVVRKPVLPVQELMARRNSRDMRLVFTKSGAVPELEGKSLTRRKNPRSVVTAQGRPVPPTDFAKQLERWNRLRQPVGPLQPNEKPSIPPEVVEIQGCYRGFSKRPGQVTISFDHLYRGFENLDVTCTNLTSAGERFLYELESGEDVQFQVTVTRGHSIIPDIHLLWLARISDPDNKVLFAASEE